MKVNYGVNGSSPTYPVIILDDDRYQNLNDPHENAEQAVIESSRLLGEIRQHIETILRNGNYTKVK